MNGYTFRVLYTGVACRHFTPVSCAAHQPTSAWPSVQPFTSTCLCQPHPNIPLLHHGGHYPRTVYPTTTCQHRRTCPIAIPQHDTRLPAPAGSPLPLTVRLICYRTQFFSVRGWFIGYCRCYCAAVRCTCPCSDGTPIGILSLPFTGFCDLPSIATIVDTFMATTPYTHPVVTAVEQRTYV